MSIADRVKKVASYSEMKAFKAVAKTCEGKKELIINVSKIAEAEGVTKSILVNVFKLLEVAGAVETRSLGMKGTHIRITDAALVKEIIEG